MDDDFLPLICPSLEIPDHWTPEMACEITDFLGDVICAIWAIHGTAMARYLEPLGAPDPRAIDGEDDLPF